MPAVVITGVETPLGRRVARLAAADPAATVLGLAGGPVVDLPDRVEVRRFDLANDDVKPHLEDADIVVHLAQTEPATATAASDDVATARRVLDAAGDTGVRHLVVLSTAAVYGAWANNPVPLTEAAPLRPNPGFPFATERAEIERLVAEWRDAHPGATAAVLRPARTTAVDQPDWLAGALRPGPAAPEDSDEPPVQFLDLDDLATACELARTRGLDGAFNVAPEGSIPGEALRPLIGVPLRVPLPERLVRRFARWGLGTTPAALLPYALHPWVVAADRLRAEGWTAGSTNEEAAVSSHDAGALATLSPRRRQELALGAAGVALVGVATGVALALRRWLRR